MTAKLQHIFFHINFTIYRAFEYKGKNEH